MRRFRSRRADHRSDPDGRVSCGWESDDALLEHRIGHFHEAADVGSLDVVDEAVVFKTVIDADMVDRLHDRMEPTVDFRGGPGESQGILAHFETARGDAAGIGRLAWPIKNASLEKQINRLGR